MERASVIVVGSGVAGASAACWLSASRDVLLLEQGELPGAEASAQNAGMLRRLVTDPVERALACRSAELVRAWEQSGQLAAGEAFRPIGAVVALHHAGPRERALEHAAEDLQARGLRVEAFEGAPPVKVAPALAGARLHYAWWLPDEGLLDAHALVSACLRGARARGARVAFGRPVTRLVTRAGRAIGVDTPEGRILADDVVLASGAWGAWLAATAGLDRALVPLQRHLLMSDPHPLSSPDHPYCWIDDEGLYLRPEAGGWLLSPCDERAVAPPAGPGSKGPVDPLVRALAIDKLERLLPAVADLRLGSGWTGLRTFAPDRRPWIGADPDIDGLWWASGLGGAGVTCALAVGEALRAAMEGRTLPDLDLGELSPARRTGLDTLPAGALKVLPGPGKP